MESTKRKNRYIPEILEEILEEMKRMNAFREGNVEVLREVKPEDIEIKARENIETDADDKEVAPKKKGGRKPKEREYRGEVAPKATVQHNEVEEGKAFPSEE